MLARSFLVPPALIFGSGASEKVGEEIGKLGVKKGLIVTDEVLLKLGILEGIEQALTQARIQFEIYSGVFTEPTVEFVEEGLKAYKENGCDFLLAVGGGSAIDTTKAIAVMATNPGPIENYQGANKVKEPP